MSDTRKRAGPKQAYDFDRGDRVRVCVRENGETGRIQANMDCDVLGFRSRPGPGHCSVVLDPPWDSQTRISLRPHEAEFEVLSTDE